MTMAVSVTSAPNTKAAMSTQALTFLQQHVRQTTGIVLDSGKEYLLETRLGPVLSEMKLATYEQLCTALIRQPQGTLNNRIVDAITTNETLFFRDIATFESLRKEILPELLQTARGRKLRIWSAAASSGQEAYSLAMMLLEMNVSPSQVEIIGTDISEEILDKAREGKYVQFEVNRGLSTTLLMKYFTRVGLAWQVKDTVRSMITFRQGDLRKSGGLGGKFDLILCRNVLIYFDGPTKQQILHTLHGNLAGHGLLVLGCAETLINTAVPLHRRVAGQAAFYSPTLHA